MDLSLTALVGNLLAPTVLFFILGLIAAVARSDLSIPDGAAKIMSIYLLMAIGFKGGAAVGQEGVSGHLIGALIAGGVLSFVLPFVAFVLLRGMTRLDNLNAAAVAGHYGSISIVTFVTAVSLLEARGLSSEGYMVAVAAVMEVPAIMSALWLAARRGGVAVVDCSLLKHILGNGSIVLLIGAFTIGAITGQEGLADLEPFIVVPFTGVLALFLLDMGLSAGRSLLQNRQEISAGVLIFGMVMPLVGSLFGLGAAVLVGLSTGGVFLMMVLSASASYIAVPAAMRLALPQAKSGIYLSLALGVTFPFNLTVGMPVYFLLATLV
ncbi:sodium-dependent bicarbonate transport family permease [Thalassobius sp. Cn5-15]|uniref:sodium-dependent bicarbonate transport family permease n=1 Tax=Thalassobius sp. Cn5-15 TaxID=2917763 RepID=UPI001EF2D689|nr:sodium-dependent bicarbonate transport family permease [Thalassobius sp. Cn5-15]MCG7495220.1 sodium-dependent bicarbonate transport family permease [Thalassobius sp. Cn5-15]